MGKVLGGGLIGGIITFIWMWISWAVLPWHDWAFQKFENEEFISWVIQENAPKDGVYTIPAMNRPQKKSLKEQKEGSLKQREKLEKGPFVYLYVSKKGMNPTNPRLYLISFLIRFFGAGAISAILFQLKQSCGYWKRLFVVVLFGFAVAALAVLPQWNWFASGAEYALVSFADSIAAWFFAGLALAAFVRPKHIELAM